MGDNSFATLCVEDSGECIHQVFNNADEYKGKVISLASENLKTDEYAAIISKAVDGKKFVAAEVSIKPNQTVLHYKV